MKYRRGVHRLAMRACSAGVFSGVLALGLAPVPLAQAQTASEIAVAKQWFADGLAHEEKGEFAAALELFRRAAQVKRTPQIVYHVGFCESRTGALVEALVDLDNAGALARSAHADNVVTAARDELADVKKRVPTLEVRVKGDVAIARLLVDGTVIATSVVGTPMPLDPGEHTVTVDFASGVSASQRATLAEHEVKIAMLAPPAGAPATVASLAAPSQPPPSSSDASSPSSPSSASLSGSASRSSTTAWVLVGVGAALAVGGGSLFAAARVKEGTLHGECPSRVNCDPSLESDYNAATTFNSVGIGLGAVGLAALGLGVTMLVVRSSPSSASALVVSPRGFAWTATF